MKKLTTLMLGMALAFTVVAPTFAQDPPKKEKKTKAKSTKAPKKTAAPKS
jgi:Flp pilus assembly protein TadD